MSALPVDRTTFGAYVLERLGSGAITINVTANQLDSRINDAIQYFQDNHYDGTEKIYFKYQITQTDIDNKFVLLSDPSITDVVRIFDITGLTNQASIFDFRYQIALNDLYTLTQQSLVPFFMTMQHLSLLEQMLVGAKAIRFNRYQNKVFVDMDWTRISIGTYIIFECNRAMNPDNWPAMWSDRWLIRYATALVKRNWGSNLSKFVGVQMPGGVTFNGTQIYNEAVEEIKELEEQMQNNFTLPLDFQVG